MKKGFTAHIGIKLVILFSFLFSPWAIILTSGQTDHSYLKLTDPKYKRIPENFIPPSKYGNAVTPANLKEALKNPGVYTGANFNNSGLITVPEEIFQFTNLIEIDLSHNSISVLPLRLKELKKLKELHVNNNRLTSLGSEITSCVYLEKLQIQNNPLNTISIDIGNMKNLKELWIEGIDKNCSIPPEIWSLLNLNKLHLIDVNLKTIPSGISGMKKLNELCLSHNSISAVPDEIFELKKLTYLNLGYNVIASVPNSINNLKNLDYFGIYGNPVPSLPHEIQELKKLSFLSCWNTNLKQEEIVIIKKSLPDTEVHDTDKGIH